MGEQQKKNKLSKRLLNILDVFSVIFRLLGIVSIVFASAFMFDPDADGPKYVVQKNTWPLFGIVCGYLMAFVTRYFGAVIVLLFFAAKLLYIPSGSSWYSIISTFYVLFILLASPAFMILIVHFLKNYLIKKSNQ